MNRVDFIAVPDDSVKSGEPVTLCSVQQPTIVPREGEVVEIDIDHDDGDLTYIGRVIDVRHEVTEEEVVHKVFFQYEPGVTSGDTDEN